MFLEGEFQREDPHCSPGRRCGPYRLLFAPVLIDQNHPVTYVATPILRVETASSLDQRTVEHFAKTINALKGQVTILFITYQVPKGLQVGEVFSFGANSQHR